jgi:hypothetical protein
MSAPVSSLLPVWARKKLIEASAIKDDMQRRIEIDRISAAVKMDRPDLFRTGGDDGDDTCGFGK